MDRNLAMVTAPYEHAQEHYNVNDYFFSDGALMERFIDRNFEIQNVNGGIHNEFDEIVHSSP